MPVINGEILARNLRIIASCLDLSVDQFRHSLKRYFAETSDSLQAKKKANERLAQYFGAHYEYLKSRGCTRLANAISNYLKNHYPRNRSGIGLHQIVLKEDGAILGASEDEIRSVFSPIKLPHEFFTFYGHQSNNGFAVHRDYLDLGNVNNQFEEFVNETIYSTFRKNSKIERRPRVIDETWKFQSKYVVSTSDSMTLVFSGTLNGSKIKNSYIWISGHLKFSYAMGDIDLTKENIPPICIYIICQIGEPKFTGTIISPDPDDVTVVSIHQAICIEVGAIPESLNLSDDDSRTWYQPDESRPRIYSNGDTPIEQFFAFVRSTAPRHAFLDFSIEDFEIMLNRFNEQRVSQSMTTFDSLESVLESNVKVVVDQI